jgi:hypothetical protein
MLAIGVTFKNSCRMFKSIAIVIAINETSRGACYQGSSKDEGENEGLGLIRKSRCRGSLTSIGFAAGGNTRAALLAFTFIILS